MNAIADGILKWAGFLLIGLGVLFFALLFVYEQGKSEGIGQVISAGVLIFQITLVFAPIPKVVMNRVSNAIDDKACVVFALYSFAMIWLFFIR